jgi:uncharacterized phiE125 gp8 family phage protein
MKRGQYQIKTAPTIEPITLEEAKAHLKVDFDEEDSLIQIYISAARAYAEEYCNRAFLTQTIVHTLDYFPACTTSNPLSVFKLYRTPVQSVVSVKYKDADNVEAEVAADKLILSNIDSPAKLGKLPTFTWPETADVPGAVTLEYVSGETTAEKVPSAIKVAIFLILAKLYEVREDSIQNLPTASENLMSPYRIREF